MVIQHREDVSILTARQREREQKNFLPNQHQLFAKVPKVKIEKMDLYNILQLRFFIISE